MALQARINKFWQYVQDNLPKINEHEALILARDPDKINAESDAYKIYNNMLELGANIYNGVYVNLRVNYINLPSGVIDLIKNKFGPTVLPILHRFELLITGNGDVNLFPVITQIYETSKLYNLMSLIPVKFHPHNMITPKHVVYNNFSIQPDNMKYICQKFNKDKLDLIIVLEDEIINTIVKDQKDVYGLRDTFVNYLENLFGEYNTHLYITKFTLIPATLYANKFGMELKNFTEFYHEIWSLLPTRKICNICKMSDMNITINGDVCNDCKRGIDNLSD